MSKLFPLLEDTKSVHRLDRRVTYAETDRMGYAYHGNYVSWFEQGRVEWLRAYGQAYAALEESGTLLPVSSLAVEYHHPLRYDEEFVVQTCLESYRKARLTFLSSIHNGQGVLCSTAKVVLACVTSAGRPKKLPEALQALARLRAVKGESP
ncbi:MAG: acyl-CoA thioesterase [Planctomycetota bacterium]